MKAQPSEHRARASWKQLLWRRLRGLAVLALTLVTIALGIYLLAPQWIVQFDQWRQASAAGLDTHTIEAGGSRWVYYEGGSGPTLMLLHGFDGSRGNWVQVARELTPNFHVLIPDLPGWGDSGREKGADYAPPAQARRLAAFVDRVAPRNLVLIGHSMGGLIAGEYAAAHPDHVAALGFIDSDGVGHQTAAVRDKDMFAYDDRAGFERLLRLVFDQPPSLPGRIKDVYIARNRARSGMLDRTYQALQQPAQAHGLEPLLPGIDKPVMVMWCHGDKLIDAAAVNVFRQHLDASPRIDVTTLFGCSHMPMLEKPHATAQGIIRFLLPVRPPAPAAPAKSASTGTGRTNPL